MLRLPLTTSLNGPGLQNVACAPMWSPALAMPLPSLSGNRK
jgi:hypothetical protein